MKHLETLLERALDAVVGMDDAGKVIAWNGAAEEMFGWKRDEAIGASMGELIVPPQHREGHAKGLEHYKRTGEGPVLETRIRITGLHRNGHEIPVELSIFPMHEEGGPVSFYAFIRSLLHEDAIQREQEARAAEGKAALAVAQKLLDEVSLDDFTKFCLATVCSVTGMDAGHLQIVRGTGPDARLYPSNVWHLADQSFAPVLEVTEEIRFGYGEGLPGRAWETGKLQVIEDLTTFPIFMRKDVFASVGLTRGVALPVYHAGQVHGVMEFFGTSKARLDPDNLRMIQTIGSQIGVAIRRKENSEYRETLRHEMSHRVGNSLSVLASIYRSCSRAAETKEELDELYLPRLTAVARASRLALNRASQEASLQDLVTSALEVFPDRSRIEVDAPHVMVQSDSVMPLALILNELATNTLKHSALSEEGSLNIRVAVDEATDELVMNWTEASAPKPHEPSDPNHTGFGTTLMQVMIEDQLGGKFERDIDATGFRMAIRFPRDRMESGRNSIGTPDPQP